MEKNIKRYLAIQSDPKLPLDAFIVMAEGSVGEIKEAARPCAVGDILDVMVEEQYLHNKEDAISRLDGYILQILGGGKYLGERVKVKIKSVSKTSAVAEIIN